MKILAVDTSGFEGSVAVSEDRNVLEQRSLSAAGRRHAQTLVMEAATLLHAHSLTPDQIDVAAVSIGPGSFTGLRVGVVFAKTFAWANNAKLVAVNTLQAIAEQLPHRHPLATVISDAQRGEVFVNRYEWNEDSQSRIPTGPLSIEDIDAVADPANASDSGIVTGPGLTKFAERFSDAWQLADNSTWLPAAATVAQLGSILADCGAFAHIHTLEPLYVRRSYAEEKRPKS